MRPRLSSGLLLLFAVLAVTGCVRGKNPDDLDGLMRPRNGGPPPVVPSQPPAKEVGSIPPDKADWYVARSGWAGQSIDQGNIEPMEPVYRITVHHSGDANDALGDPREHLRQFERAHKMKGWACIGYHFIISRDGTVYEGRPIAYQGAHAVGDNNKGNIGICLMGNLDNRPVPDAQKKALFAVLDRLTRQYSVEKDELFGHRHFKTTDCPGRYGLLALEEYKNRPIARK